MVKLTERQKRQRSSGRPGAGKPKEKENGEIRIELIKEGPRNEKTGYKITKVKGGGIAQRGLGRAFNKGGKV